MKCELCDWEVPDGDTGGILGALDHIRVMHPDQYGDGPERWPDGDVVVYDDTLTPDEFGGAK